jgi:chloramphenicol O-acetyltransferase
MISEKKSIPYANIFRAKSIANSIANTVLSSEKNVLEVFTKPFNDNKTVFASTMIKSIESYRFLFMSNSNRFRITIMIPIIPLI